MSDINFITADFVTEAACKLRLAYPQWAKAHWHHIERAVLIAKAGKVTRDRGSAVRFTVQSDRGGIERGVTYGVDRELGTCSCPDFRIHRGACKHRIAVFLRLQAEIAFRDFQREYDQWQATTAFEALDAQMLAA